MDDDWQRIDDDSVKPAPKVIAPDVNKWAGEDEDDDIKDSWDADDDDEKKDEEKVENAAPLKPKKKLQQKISEKEKQRLELEEKRRKEKEEEEYAKMTPEELEAEKRRLKKLQEEADTRTALDSLGLSSTSATIDSFNPKSKEDFTEFAELLNRRIQQFKSHEEYVPFLDELVKGLCAGLQSTNIKKIKTTVDNLFIEKQKLEKGDKPKKKPAAKIKAKLRMEGDDDFMTRAGAYEADDYDDFM